MYGIRKCNWYEDGNVGLNSLVSHISKTITKLNNHNNDYSETIEHVGNVETVGIIFEPVALIASVVIWNNRKNVIMKALHDKVIPLNNQNDPQTKIT